MMVGIVPQENLNVRMVSFAKKVNPVQVEVQHICDRTPNTCRDKTYPLDGQNVLQKLQQYMTTFEITSPVDVGWHFTVYCRNILGEVCTDQCARLSSCITKHQGLVQTLEIRKMLKTRLVIILTTVLGS